MCPLIKKPQMDDIKCDIWLKGTSIGGWAIIQSIVYEWVDMLAKCVHRSSLLEIGLMKVNGKR